MCSVDCYPDKAKTVNEVLEVLRHHLRREVVHYFENITDRTAVTFDELAAHVAARVPDRNREELSTVLLHMHLPKLKADGWLDFDQRSQEVRYYGHEAVPQVLEELTDIFTD